MSDALRVLIVRSESDQGSDVVSKAYGQVASIFGLQAESCLYNDIVLPKDETKRYPHELGNEWEVKLAGERRENLSNFNSFIFLALLDSSSSEALWTLTLRGSENIFGNKHVVLVDPERKVSPVGSPILLALFNEKSRFTKKHDYFKSHTAKLKILEQFAQLMSEVDHK